MKLNESLYAFPVLVHDKFHSYPIRYGGALGLLKTVASTRTRRPTRKTVLPVWV